MPIFDWQPPSLLPLDGLRSWEACRGEKVIVITRRGSSMVTVALLVCAAACGGGVSEVAPTTTVASTMAVTPATEVVEDPGGGGTDEAQAWFDSLRAAHLAEGGAAYEWFWSRCGVA